jgi:hypothetical protein
MVIGVVAVATLLLTAFDDNTVPSSSGAPVPAPLPVKSEPPEAQVLATVGNLRVQSPVAREGVTAVGFHGSAEGALALQPVGPQANEGLLARLWRKITGSSRTGLAWYQLESGALRTLEIGAEIELRPTSAPSLVVTIQNVRPDKVLAVGANVAAGSSKLGRVADVSRFERQSLERFAADGGNNVAIQVYPSATLGVP